MKNYILILLTVISLLSCKDDDKTNFYTTFIGVDSADVPSEFTLGETYDITIHYTLPNDCHSFSNFYYAYEDTTRVVAIIALVNGDGTCPDKDTIGKYTFSVKATQNENYIFKFWQGKNKYLIIEVPVVD